MADAALNGPLSLAVLADDSWLLMVVFFYDHTRPSVVDGCCLLMVVCC